MLVNGSRFSTLSRLVLSEIEGWPLALQTRVCCRLITQKLNWSPELNGTGGGCRHELHSCITLRSRNRQIIHDRAVICAADLCILILNTGSAPVTRTISAGSPRSNVKFSVTGAPATTGAFSCDGFPRRMHGNRVISRRQRFLW
jgi:hypothetical protein